MRLLFQATVPKFASEPEQNEDEAAGRPLQGIYAISDGATESYNSKAWAKVLVTRFVETPSFSAEWLCAAVLEYNRSFDREAMTWSAQAAFDRGSFATLLGLVAPVSAKRARVLGIGDSVALLVDGARILDSFPYKTAEQFRTRPQLLSTIADLNTNFVQPSLVKQCVRSWDLKGLRNPLILLMTDALGAWLLSAPGSRLNRVLSLPSKIAFGALIDSERASGTMRRDDTTLIILG